MDSKCISGIAIGITMLTTLGATTPIIQSMGSTDREFIDPISNLRKVL